MIHMAYVHTQDDFEPHFKNFMSAMGIDHALVFPGRNRRDYRRVHAMESVRNVFKLLLANCHFCKQAFRIGVDSPWKKVWFSHKCHNTVYILPSESFAVALDVALAGSLICTEAEHVECVDLTEFPFPF